MNKPRVRFMLASYGVCVEELRLLRELERFGLFNRNSALPKCLRLEYEGGHVPSLLFCSPTSPPILRLLE